MHSQLCGIFCEICIGIWYICAAIHTDKPACNRLWAHLQHKRPRWIEITHTDDVRADVDRCVRLGAIAGGALGDACVVRQATALIDQHGCQSGSEILVVGRVGLQWIRGVKKCAYLIVFDCTVEGGCTSGCNDKRVVGAHVQATAQRSQASSQAAARRGDLSERHLDPLLPARGVYYHPNVAFLHLLCTLALPTLTKGFIDVAERCVKQSLRLLFRLYLGP